LPAAQLVQSSFAIRLGGGCLTGSPNQLLVVQELAFAHAAKWRQRLSLCSGWIAVCLPFGWQEETKENNQHGVDPTTRFNASLIGNVAVVNGAYRPVLTEQAGHRQRWRFLNAGGISSWI